MIIMDRWFRRVPTIPVDGFGLHRAHLYAHAATYAFVLLMDGLETKILLRILSRPRDLNAAIFERLMSKSGPLTHQSRRRRVRFCPLHKYRPKVLSDGDCWNIERIAINQPAGYRITGYRSSENRSACNLRDFRPRAIALHGKNSVHDIEPRLDACVEVNEHFGKIKGVWTFDVDSALRRPGMQPNWFFTHPVNLKKPCVLSLGSEMTPSLSVTLLQW